MPSRAHHEPCALVRFISGSPGKKVASRLLRWAALLLRGRRRLPLVPLGVRVQPVQQAIGHREELGRLAIEAPCKLVAPKRESQRGLNERLQSADRQVLPDLLGKAAVALVNHLEAVLGEADCPLLHLLDASKVKRHPLCPVLFLQVVLLPLKVVNDWTYSVELVDDVLQLIPVESKIALRKRQGRTKSLTPSSARRAKTTVAAPLE